MPLVTVYTSAPPPAEPSAQALLRKLSSAIVDILGKPEAYAMTCLVQRSQMMFAGSFDPACLVDVRSIGSLAGDKPKQMTEAVCRFIQEELRVPKDRTFVVFTDVPARLWGFDGSTIG
jgi:phenylpyruvate tautomerase PptA (4-oxalocrotonate tautomerase family)